MKMFTLFVFPTAQPKGSPFTAFIVTVSNIFRIAAIGKSKNITDIIYHLSSSFQNIIIPGLVAGSTAVNRNTASQQHIYAPVGQQPVNGKLAGSHLIRFSNGRTPYITKQVIF